MAVELVDKGCLADIVQILLHRLGEARWDCMAEVLAGVRRVSRKSWRVWLSVCPRLLFAFFLIVLDSMLHSKLKTPRRFIPFIG